MPKRLTADLDAQRFGERLVAILERTGRPRRGAGAYLAKRYVVSVPTANAWLNGEHRCEPELAERIATDHRSSFEYLYLGKGDPEPIFTSNASEAPALLPFREVPIVGRARGGDNGYYYEEGYPVGHGAHAVHFPTRDRNAYGLRIEGDSMAPRIRHGEYVIVEPNVEARPGDDVVVKTADGKHLCKRLLIRSEEVVTLGSINDDHPTMTIHLSQVEYMRRVAGILPNGAFVR